jgi:hypothetical protein
MLTDKERELLAKIGDIWVLFCGITGQTSTRDDDLQEIISAIHLLQRYVMSNAAARAYPDEYRALGETLQ